MERDEGGIFSETPDCKSFFFFFCLKFKQNLCCPKKEYNVIYKNINQNIRVYRRSKKKSELIKDSENVLAYWKESEQSESLA